MTDNLLGGRHSDLMEISDTLELNGLLAIELLNGWKFYSKNQESYLTSGDNTLKYFKLEKGTRQGHPISTYLFALVLEIVFLFIKENKNIKGLNIFNHTFLYTAYTDDTTLFLIEAMKVFSIFSSFSGLKPSWCKCEVIGIDAKWPN